jgi:hypothetical protein
MVFQDAELLPILFNPAVTAVEPGRSLWCALLHEPLAAATAQIPVNVCIGHSVLKEMANNGRWSSEASVVDDERVYDYVCLL